MNATAPATALPLGVDVSSAVDGLYWGVILSTVLLGVLIVQAWMYVNDNKDGWPLRTFVATVIGLDIATTAFDTQYIHAYFIVNFGNLANLALINKSILLEYIVTIIVIFLVQLFFASRVYLLNREKGYVLPGIIVITACISFGAGIYTIVQEWKVPLVANLASRTVRISVGFDNLFRVICDLTATIALSWSLAQAQRQSRVKNTVTMLQKLLAFIVARGLLVTVVTFAFGIMYLVHPDSLYWMPLHLMLSKLYVITMIGILNSRSWIHDSDAEDTIDLPLAFTASIDSTTTPTRIAASDSQAFEVKKDPDS